MRIVIAGPPKAGNVWLKCILGTVYGLQPLGPQAVPERPRLDLFKEWIARGGFGDGTIFHQHYDYSDLAISMLDFNANRGWRIVGNDWLESNANFPVSFTTGRSAFSPSARKSVKPTPNRAATRT